MTHIIEFVFNAALLLLAFALMVVAADCLMWLVAPCPCDDCREKRVNAGQRLSTTKVNNES
jgi:hypothetical protein